MQTISPKRVIAAVIEKDGRYLIAQRAQKDDLYGKWEFPGGKMEPGETDHETLTRELIEEFSILPHIGSHIVTIEFTHKEKLMHMVMYHVKSFKGELQVNEHQQIRWVLPTEFSQYEFPEPDRPVIYLLTQVHNTMAPNGCIIKLY